MRQEAEARKTEEFMQRQKRAAEEAERKRREDEERTRHAARTRYPRSAVHGNVLVCTLAPGVTLDLVRVQAGEFLMGSDPARDRHAQPIERPQHRVRLSEYFISRTPITWQEFARFRSTLRVDGPAIPAGHEQHPVTQVSWDDALAFCNWLSGPGWKYRLPTEAEWEKATRGANAQIFPWGDSWGGDRANVAHAHTGTTPVGAYSPAGDSPYGLQDTIGNVWEWCRDWYDAETYAQSQVIQDPIGPTVGDGAVIRGGAFDSPLKHARAATRNWDYPFKRRSNIGFRVVAQAVVEV
jgi:formylglycine-generating enzyme required for sulfatase activity